MDDSRVSLSPGEGAAKRRVRERTSRLFEQPSGSFPSSGPRTPRPYLNGSSFTR